MERDTLVEIQKIKMDTRSLLIYYSDRKKNIETDGNGSWCFDDESLVSLTEIIEALDDVCSKIYKLENHNRF